MYSIQHLNCVNIVKVEPHHHAGVPGRWPTITSPRIFRRIQFQASSLRGRTSFVLALSMASAREVLVNRATKSLYLSNVSIYIYVALFILFSGLYFVSCKVSICFMVGQAHTKFIFLISAGLFKILHSLDFPTL